MKLGKKNLISLNAFSCESVNIKKKEKHQMKPNHHNRCKWTKWHLKEYDQFWSLWSNVVSKSSCITLINETFLFQEQLSRFRLNIAFIHRKIDKHNLWAYKTCYAVFVIPIVNSFTVKSLFDASVFHSTSFCELIQNIQILHSYWVTVFYSISTSKQIPPHWSLIFLNDLKLFKSVSSSKSWNL